MLPLATITTATLHAHTVPLHHVLEIREGQLTKWFHHFPYEEVDGQSLSLVYEEERS